jgi:hypothetical protein
MLEYTSSTVQDVDGFAIDNNFDEVRGDPRGCCGVGLNYGPITAVIAKGSDIWEQRGQFLFQLENDNNCPTANTGWCLVELDDNPTTILVAAGGNGQLYQLHSDGSLWQSTGACFHCWTRLDDNPLTFTMVAGAGKLFQAHTDGTVWKSTGSCFHCWEKIDNRPLDPNSFVTSLALDTTGTLYELRDSFDPSGTTLESAAIYKGLGQFSWQGISFGLLAIKLMANSRLYQQDEVIAPLFYQSSSNSWQQIPGNPGFILAPGGNSDALYTEHTDGSVFVFTPESGHWVMLSGPTSAGQLLSQPVQV